MKKGEFVEYVKVMLHPFGEITSRTMFGGYGIYKNGLMIALIAQGELYFKADAKAAEYFKTEGSEPFVYYGKQDKPVTMSYYKILPDVMDDENELGKWVNLAYGAALQGKDKGKKKHSPSPAP